MAKDEERTDRVVATNRRARHDYELEQSFEAGIQLLGSEVKTLRDGKGNLQDSYGVIRGGEIFVHGIHIPEYKQASYQNHDPIRVRKLLMHGAQIAKIAAKIEQQGYALVPLKLYFKGNKVKVEIALGRGRKRYDKRQAIAKREAEREMAKRAGSVRRGEARR
jgi:SsrA-binding protein